MKAIPAVSLLGFRGQGRWGDPAPEWVQGVSLGIQTLSRYLQPIAVDGKGKDRFQRYRDFFAATSFSPPSTGCTLKPLSYFADHAEPLPVCCFPATGSPFAFSAAGLDC